MYIAVIPISHTIDTEALTYFCPQGFAIQIQIGSLVEVPIRASTTYAIVSGLDTTPSEHIIEDVRSIICVACTTPLLPEDTIIIVPKLASLYLVPIHKVLLLFLPKSLLTALEKKNFESLTQSVSSSLGVGTHSIEFFHNSRVTPDIMEHYLSEGTVVILPDDILLRSCKKYFSHLLSTALFLFSDATITRKIRGWTEMQVGKYPICFGTRRLLYYNLSHYRKILYIEDAFAREYYQHPYRFKNIDVLALYSQFSLHDIHILTSIPAIETLFKLRNFPINNQTGNSILTA